VLFALGQPVAFAGLLAAFLLGIVLRAVAIRFTARRLGVADRHERIAPRLREDIDPFGAVAAAIGGVGWGKMLSVDDVPRWPGRGRAALVFLAGPLTCIILAEVLLAAYAVLFPDYAPSYVNPAEVLLGFGLDLPAGGTVLLSLAVGLLGFGLLALIPIPPLDGFGVLYCALRKPGPSIQWMRLWFEEKNLGVVVLVLLSLFPLPGAILLQIVNLLALPFVGVWR
jgi:Zn-dependent protease